MEAEPGIDAPDVEEVAAVRQSPKHVGGLIIGEADGAAGGGGVLVIHLLRLRVEQLRVAGERGLVEPPLRRGIVGRGGRMGGPGAVGAALGEGEGVGAGVAGAVVGGEGDGGDEEEDAHGDADAVAEAADALRAEEAAGVGRGVHDGGGAAI